MAFIGCPRCGKTVKDSDQACPHCGATLSPTAKAPSVAVPTGPQIACEKCKAGLMVATNIPRFNPALRFIGYTLALPSIAILLVATVFVIFVAGVSGKAVADAAKVDPNNMARLEQELSSVPGVTNGPQLAKDVMEDVRSGKSIDNHLGQLTPAARDQALEAIYHYSSGVTGKAGGAAVGAAAMTGIGGCGLVGLYFVLVPTMIVGFVLTLGKKVWRCGNCSFVYDRA